MSLSQAPAYQSKLRIPGHPKGERTILCRVSSLRDGLLQIKTSEPVASGLAVSVELEDALVIGEVTESAPKPDAWLIEIRVEQILNGLMNLMALQAKLLGENVKPASMVQQPASRSRF